MKSSLCRLLMSVVCLFLFPVASSQAFAPASAGRPQPSHTIEALHTSSPPVMFIQNVGQYDPSARFLLPAGDHDLWLSEDGIRLTLRLPAEPGVSPGERPRLWARTGPDVHLRLSFAGANPHPRLEPFDRLETRVSYFLRNDPTEWRADVPVWAGVRYENLYPGLDLEVTGADGHWSWRLVPGDGSRGRWQASPTAVRLRLEGVDGVALTTASLLLATRFGQVSLPLLGLAEELEAGGVPAATLFDKKQVIAPFVSPPSDAASIPAADQPRDISYATFLGGAGSDGVTAVVVDGDGYAYVTGHTASADFPAASAAGYDNDLNGGTDAFIAKLNPAGSALVYATFVGGSDTDYGQDLAVDVSGNAYVVGQTKSSDFPLMGYDSSFNGGDYDAFVFKLNPSGLFMTYSTYLGGSGDDYGNGIAVDAVGNAYAAGETYSSNFPVVTGAYDTSLGGTSDCFVTKIDVPGTSLTYSTFLGGSGEDECRGIALDSNANAFLTGETSSENDPAAAAPPGYDFTYGGDNDGFATKLSAGGAFLYYATYLGGSWMDWGNAITVDSAGCAYVAGATDSDDFPAVLGPGYDTTYNTHVDAMVVKLSSAGTSLVYATFLGGSSGDVPYGIAVDSAGNATVAGYTASSTDFPAVSGPGYDTSYNGGISDTFVVRLGAAGTTLSYATFLGGSDSEFPDGVTVDAGGHAYVVGETSSANFPAALGPGYDATKGGTYDGFLVKLWMDSASYGEQVSLPIVQRD